MKYRNEDSYSERPGCYYEHNCQNDGPVHKVLLCPLTLSLTFWPLTIAALFLVCVTELLSHRAKCEVYHHIENNNNNCQQCVMDDQVNESKQGFVYACHFRQQGKEDGIHEDKNKSNY